MTDLSWEIKGQTYTMNLVVFLHKLCISSRIMVWSVNGNVDQAAFGSSEKPWNGAKDLHSAPDWLQLAVCSWTRWEPVWPSVSLCATMASASVVSKIISSHDSQWLFLKYLLWMQHLFSLVTCFWNISTRWRFVTSYHFIPIWRNVHERINQTTFK